MNRKSIVRMSGAALLAAGVALTFAPPASGSPTALHEALERDLGLTPEQAEVRLQQEKQAFAAERSLRGTLGSDFAGAYFDAAAGTLVVNVTDAARTAEVTAAGAQAKVVSHSAAVIKSKLDQGMASVPKSVTGWRVDETTNAVVVSVLGDASHAQAWAAGLGAGTVSFEHVTEAPQTMWNLIGGQAIRTSAGGRCSLGFNARSGSARFVITAGHCTDIGGTWSGSGGTIGTSAGSSFPGNDYGIIRVSSSAAVSTALVDRYSAGSDVTVAGSQQAGVGAGVCRSGSTTGWRCGTINARNTTVCYPQGCVGGMIRTNVCAEPGDSGGSLVTNPGSGTRVQAQGMTSGGSGNCSSGGTTFFQPVGEALSAFGLTLVTG